MLVYRRSWKTIEGSQQPEMITDLTPNLLIVETEGGGDGRSVAADETDT